MLMTHCDSPSPTPNSWRRVWKATLTTVESRNTINRPKVMESRMVHFVAIRRGRGLDDDGIVALMHLSPDILAMRAPLQHGQSVLRNERTSVNEPPGLDPDLERRHDHKPDAADQEGIDNDRQHVNRVLGQHVIAGV